MRLFDAPMRIPKSRIIILLTGLNTQPDRTLFFLIFIYLSHRSLEIMAQMQQYIIFLSLKPIKVSSYFILNYLKKLSSQKYQKQTLKP